MPDVCIREAFLKRKPTGSPGVRGNPRRVFAFCTVVSPGQMQKHLCRPGKKVEVLSAFDPAFSAQRKEVPKAYVPLRGYERIKDA